MISAKTPVESAEPIRVNPSRRASRNFFTSFTSVNIVRLGLKTTHFLDLLLCNQ